MFLWQSSEYFSKNHLGLLTEEILPTNYVCSVTAFFCVVFLFDATCYHSVVWRYTCPTIQWTKYFWHKSVLHSSMLCEKWTMRNNMAVNFFSCLMKMNHATLHKSYNNCKYIFSQNNWCCWMNLLHHRCPECNVRHSVVDETILTDNFINFHQQ